MTDATNKTNEEASTVDEYTARMDRMLNSLQNKSRSARVHQSHMTWIWLSAGVVVSAGLIYLALSMSSHGFQDAFHALYN